MHNAQPECKGLGAKCTTDALEDNGSAMQCKAIK